MNPSLETLATVARERPVPWSAERAARVERSIVRGRERSRLVAPAAWVALGGLASVALFTCLVRLSSALREASPLERASAVAESSAGRPAVEVPTVATSRVVMPEADSSDLDRPIGDGGFADSGS